MNYLLDTSVFLWLLEDEDHIPLSTLDAIASSDNQLFLSSVSVWEIWQKHVLGKLVFKTGVKQIIDAVCDAYMIGPLAFTANDCVHLAKLPAIHKDPFDRMLICQAIQNNLTIVTSDKSIRDYPIATLW